MTALFILNSRDALLGFVAGWVDVWLFLKSLPWLGDLVLPKLWAASSRIRWVYVRQFAFAVSYMLVVGAPVDTAFCLFARGATFFAVDQVTFRYAFIAAFCTAGLLLPWYQDRRRKRHHATSPRNAGPH